MKFIKSILPTGHVGDKPKLYKFLVIENTNDLEIFSNANAFIKAKQSINFWMGFKQEKYYNTPYGYVAHQVEAANTMASVMATKLTFSDKPVSITDYCNFSDKVINDIHHSMLKMLCNGFDVRVNQSTGFCPISTDELSGYDEVKSITDQEAVSFLLNNGDINYKFEINSSNLIIENDKYAPDSLVKLLEGKDYQLISLFKQRTIMFKPIDFFNLFKDGINNGLRSIYFATTGQDISQIQKLTQVLEQVMKALPNAQLNIYAKLYSSEKQQSIKTELNNIHIRFI